MTTKMKINQYVIFIEPRKFDTADIKCFTVHCIYTFFLELSMFTETLM